MASCKAHSVTARTTRCLLVVSSCVSSSDNRFYSTVIAAVVAPDGFFDRQWITTFINASENIFRHHLQRITTEESMHMAAYEWLVSDWQSLRNTII